MIVSSRMRKRVLLKKVFKEGKNLQLANHVRSVEYNNISDCIKYCFIRGEVVPQTRISESPYKVWICMHTEVCEILTGECGCVAGYSESCKHVFALLHFIEHQVSLGFNKTCTSKRQIWHATVTKKGEKIHPPDKIRKILFDRPHLENEEGYYSQVQHQMFVTGFSYTDFVCILTKRFLHYQNKKR